MVESGIWNLESGIKSRRNGGIWNLESGIKSSRNDPTTYQFRHNDPTTYLSCKGEEEQTAEAMFVGCSLICESPPAKFVFVVVLTLSKRN
jgi:hypothetical protein